MPDSRRGDHRDASRGRAGAVARRLRRARRRGRRAPGSRGRRSRARRGPRRSSYPRGAVGLDRRRCDLRGTVDRRRSRRLRPAAAQRCARRACRRRPACRKGRDRSVHRQRRGRLVDRAERPDARVVATDVDPAAVACARRNGVEALEGDLFAPIPPALRGLVDVVTAVTLYVPSDELRLLPRDVQAFEPRLALDGGPAGTTVIHRAIDGAATWLAPGGTLLVECGPTQIGSVRGRARAAGFAVISVHEEEDGEERFVEARRRSISRRRRSAVPTRSRRRAPRGPPPPGRRRSPRTPGARGRTRRCRRGTR